MRNRFATPLRARIGLEQLEARDVPAVTVQLDYSFDTAGFFADPARRAVMQQAANDLGAQLTANLAAIVPGNGNTWEESFFNPATGAEVRVANPTVPANTVVVYVGGRDLVGAEAGLGGYGGYSATGSTQWYSTIQTRGPGFTLWGGAVAFDTYGTNWYFGTSAAGIGPTQVDFYSVASHELGHVLGLGTSPQWKALTATGKFVGPNAQAVYGGPVPIAADGDHWASGLKVGGVTASLDPEATLGARVTYSALDWAALKDLGWGQSSLVVPPTPPPPPTSPPPVFTPAPVNNPAAGHPVVLTGPADGTAQAFALGTDGYLRASGARVQAFPGYAGVVRAVAADFNGDGTDDIAFATGPGVGGTVRVIDGKTGNELAGATRVLDGFAGGLFLAAGDVDRDGKAELAISADAGGGTRVVVFKVANGTLTPLADFIAFGDPDFRGGSRVAMADVNKDGAADLIVGAGLGGGPRVAVYDGRSLAAGRVAHLVPDFFALDPALRSGVYVAAGDVNGDGYSDVIYSTGNTGGPRVRVVSGAAIVSNPGADMAAIPALADFFVWDAGDRKGVRVIARDLNRDGKAELIAATADPNNAFLRVITPAELGNPAGPLQNPLANPATLDGVYPG